MICLCGGGGKGKMEGLKMEGLKMEGLKMEGRKGIADS